MGLTLGQQVLGLRSPSAPGVPHPAWTDFSPMTITPLLRPTLPENLQLLQLGQSQEGPIPEPSDLVVAQEPAGTERAQTGERAVTSQKVRPGRGDAVSSVQPYCFGHKTVPPDVVGGRSPAPCSRCWKEPVNGSGRLVSPRSPKSGISPALGPSVVRDLTWGSVCKRAEQVTSCDGPFTPALLLASGALSQASSPISSGEW